MVAWALRFALALCALATALCAQAEPLQVIDDRGQPIRLAAPAQRIVSLAPHTTELLFAIDAGAHIVGAVDYSDYPQAAKTIPRVGSSDALDIEAIRALRPDLIVLWMRSHAYRQIDILKALGIPVFVNDPHRLDDIPVALERLGVLTGTSPQAQVAVAVFRQRIATSQANYAQRKPVRVFYQVWDRPLMTIGGAQVITDVLRICGAVNVFAHLPALAPVVDIEAVLAADPEMIITSGERDQAWRQAWLRWPQLQAVRAQNLVVLPPDLLSRMGPRMAEGVEQVCAAVEQVRAKRK